MPVRPLRHSDWQILRAAKRSKKPPTGRELRISPTPRTKDGSFLTVLVEEGLLAFVAGSRGAPFEATYALTEKGQYAAEYGEYEYELKRPATIAPKAAIKPAKKSVKKSSGRKK